MFGAGEYVPDPTEGIVDVHDLPKPILVPDDYNYAHRPCPQCGHLAYRHKSGQRTLHELGDLQTGRSIDLVVTYSSPYCSTCRKHFTVDLSDVALPGSHYTRRVMQLAVRLGVEDGLPYRPASWHLWRDHRVFVPFGTLPNWVEAGGKKGPRTEGGCRSGLGTGVVFGLGRSRRALRGALLCVVGRRQSTVQADSL